MANEDAVDDDSDFFANYNKKRVLETKTRIAYQNFNQHHYQADNQEVNLDEEDRMKVLKIFQDVKNQSKQHSTNHDNHHLKDNINKGFEDYEIDYSQELDPGRYNPAIHKLSKLCNRYDWSNHFKQSEKMIDSSFESVTS